MASIAGAVQPVRPRAPALPADDPTVLILCGVLDPGESESGV